MDGSTVQRPWPASPGHRLGSAPATRQDSFAATAWKAILRLPKSQPAIALEWLLAALCLSPLLLLPLARDQGHFAYAGQVVLDGGVPYRDVFDQKGPATHYTFALALALFGQTAWGVRCFFFLVALLTTRLAAALGERLAGPGARLSCTLAMALAVVQGDEGTAWHTGQVEDLLLLLQLAAVWLYGNKATVCSRWRTMLAAALLGLACAYKPTAVLPGVMVLAVAGGSLPRGDRSAVLSRGTWLASSVIGFLLPWLCALGYLAARGALDDFWMVVVEFNSAYAELKNGFVKGLSMLATRWGRLTVLAACGAVAVRAASAQTTDRLLWTLSIANLAMVVWQGKYWPYHWTPLIGCLAIFAGISAARVAAELRERLRRMSLLASPAMIALLLIAAPVDLKELLGMWRDTAQVASSSSTLNEFHARFDCGAVGADAHRQAADYIREHTSPDETVLVWGYETAINFLADRRAPTRFAVDRILCLDGFKRQDEWRAEFLNSLAQTAPTYIVVVDDNGTGMWRESTDELENFTAFRELLQRDYTEETRFDRLLLYRRIAGRQRSADMEDGLPRPSRHAVDGLGRPSSGGTVSEQIVPATWAGASAGLMAGGQS